MRFDENITELWLDEPFSLCGTGRIKRRNGFSPDLWNTHPLLCLEEMLRIGERFASRILSCLDLNNGRFFCKSGYWIMEALPTLSSIWDKVYEETSRDVRAGTEGASLWTIRSRCWKRRWRMNWGELLAWKRGFACLFCEDWLLIYLYSEYGLPVSHALVTTLSLSISPINKKLTEERKMTNIKSQETL